MNNNECYELINDLVDEWTESDIASLTEYLGVSKQSYSNWLSGKITAKQLCRISTGRLKHAFEKGETMETQKRKKYSNKWMMYFAVLLLLISAVGAYTQQHWTSMWTSITFAIVILLLDYSSNRQYKLFDAYIDDKIDIANKETEKRIAQAKEELNKQILAHTGKTKH